MINLQTNFLFCHNEKTAGTSISNVLRQLDGNYYIASDLFTYDGTSLELQPLTDNVGNDLGHFPNQHTKMGLWASFIELGDYFSFGFVREPASHMVALYLQQLKGFFNWAGGILPSDLSLPIDETLSRQTKLPCGVHQFTFDWFCRVFVPTCGSTQTRKFCDLEGNQLASFVGKFENLDADWRHVCEKLEISHVPLPKTNVSPKYDYREFFTKDLWDFFYDYYKTDYEVFGYEKR